MPVVTIIGGSSKPFSVPFSGRRTRTVGKNFASLFADAQAGTTPSDSVNGGGTSSETPQVTQSGGSGSVNETTSGGNNDTISAVGNLQVQGGNNDRITVNGPLTFLGGSGDTRIQAGNATVFGNSNSTYHYVGTNAGNTQLYFNGEPQQNPNGITRFEGQKQGASNILFDASSSHGSLTANAGRGDTIQGGSSSDTISINNMTGSDNNSATLSGGSGAPNLFQFLNDKEGNYTITDFGSASGNTVGISSSQMGNVQHMLDTASVNGDNTTISLEDQTKITFLNTKHLKASDFHGF